ncbi:MAG: DUF262 domain-containing protein [Cyanobacteria bacterium P01_H01_bin.35]
MSNLFLKPEDFERIFKDHLKIETYSKSIETLFSDRLLRRIDYKPYYQRNYVWDDDKASYFIESILLGTEIPPLIFFNNAEKIEVIDGRQRFETIKRFKDNQLQLTKKGLSALKQLSRSTYNSIHKNTGIIDLFLDAKIRIVEFEIVNERKLDSLLEDKIKKEIFARYNSGITPLTTPEIDNAVYDNDPIYQYFKNILTQEPDFEKLMYDLFFKRSGNNSIEHDRGKILQFIRRHLVLKMFPIKQYSWGNSRTETLEKLFEYLSDKNPDPEPLCQSFIEKVKIVESFKQIFIEFNFKHNQLVFECLLWSMLILENEKLDLSKLKNQALLKRVGKKISNNIQKYRDGDYKQIQERYTFTAKLFETELKIKLQVYYEGSDKKTKELSKLRQTEDEDTVTKLSELESLRVTKPDPSRNSIDDIARVMERKKFLVRPSYQRSEVINLAKASAIIESILLGINLPPIFIFKRLDGISEVIDGQQRLLTILGYLGKEYVDEENNKRSTRNSNFALKDLRILKDLKNKKFEALEPALQDKILDFELFVVEIEERLNTEFDPVDLFVRLNNKPYPIKENSFEMWNSWAERGVITKIKDNVSKHREWFHLKLAKQPKDRDRMENEELYTSLVYFEFKQLQEQNIEKFLKIYKQNNRINLRLGVIKDINLVLTKVSENQEDNKLFMKSITMVEQFISKVRFVLLDEDIDKNQLDTYLKNELDSLYKTRKGSRNFRRTKQDFYILWYVFIPLNYEMVRHYRQEIKQELKDLFYRMKNTQDSNYDEKKFKKEIEKFQNKYKQDKRKLKLSDSQKEMLIKQQGNKCPISGDPLFMGDEIEVDHKKPLAIGGLDSIDNLQITHKNANRRKGTKYNNS